MRGVVKNSPRSTVSCVFELGPVTSLLFNKARVSSSVKCGLPQHLSYKGVVRIQLYVYKVLSTLSGTTQHSNVLATVSFVIQPQTKPYRPKSQCKVSFTLKRRRKQSPTSSKNSEDKSQIQNIDCTQLRSILAG